MIEGYCESFGVTGEMLAIDPSPSSQIDSLVNADLVFLKVTNQWVSSKFCLLSEGSVVLPFRRGLCPQS